MIEVLKNIDAWLLLLINSGNNPFLDGLMWWISDKFIWIPLYLFLLFKLYQKYPNETVLVGCHSHTIKAFLTEIFPDKFTFSDRLVNGAFFIFEINNDDFKLIFQFN